MKKMIEEKRIGKLLLIDVSVKISSLINDSRFCWLSDHYMGGGVVNLIGSHIIDLIHFLTGKKALRVHAIIKTFKQQSKEPMRKITSPDFCNFQMELDGGLIVTANLQSDQSNAFEHNISVLGESGNLVASSGDLICLRRTDAGDYKEEKLYIDIKDTQSPEIKQIPRMYVKGMNSMIRCLSSAFTPSDSSWNKNSISNASNFDDALYVQKIIEALTKSSVSRSWEKIE
jgi:predicted dehydrogenase